MAYNWQNALKQGLTGGLGGAGTGATIGSLGGPIGTGVGAGLGGLLGILAGILGQGQEGGFQKTSLYPKKQRDIFDMLAQQGLSNIQNPTQGFEPIRQAGLNTFFQDIVPRLQEQFAGSGSNLYSSGTLQQQLSQAGATLADRLAALQSQYGQQQQGLGLKQIGLGLTPQYQTYYQQETPGVGEKLFTGALQNAPTQYQSYQLQQILNQLKGHI